MSIPTANREPRPSRASPLAVEERRSMIIDAVMPLLIEFGPAVTSRQIAEAAGVAEGTVYRAFGDKDALLRAVLDKHLDPHPLRQALERIDPARPLADKVHAAVVLMQNRFREIFGLMSLFGDYHRPPTVKSRHDVARIFERMLAPDLARLNCTPSQVAQIIRLLTFSSSLPQLNDGISYSADELVAIILHGIAGVQPASTTDHSSTIDL